MAGARLRLSAFEAEKRLLTYHGTATLRQQARGMTVHCVRNEDHREAVIEPD
jgi:hypothetical protein